MEVPTEFAGTSVPQVKPERLKAAFELYRKYSKMPPEEVAKGTDAIQLGRTAGASLPSVSYRATMLEILTRVPQAPLAPWTSEDGMLQDAVFWEAAHIPMEWMTVGSSQTFPFDIDELVRRVRGTNKHPRSRRSKLVNECNRLFASTIVAGTFLVK